ncbi:MAG TPA: hypothetical protein DEQ02_01080 [Ruminococcaceae bacterium]|nr:hypothetical protein [Oscillospiraceae bacterium]
MSINFIRIGQRVKEYRCEKKLRQEDLAWNAELSASYLSGIETGSKQASLRSIIRIADALNVTVYNLLFGNMTGQESNDLDELAAILIDCDEAESNIIKKTMLTTAVALKRSLREHREK